ncbi:CBS domain-containing protein [Actinoplanes sp. NBRC 101535]|uniref:CBS domain-containing protein n=1 Tax=Actinoplanes sp. NBRC 101535 TaxID=3032196 RepID=UPI0024A4C74E|nr:CBS domain-containing protein [Actinoplanes sp. NBRC 101535]GLY06455.1 CBS domain-containing protein [Actinoplanes sp. NBRC 101535]
MRVHDIMTTSVQVVTQRAPVEDAVALMLAHEVTALPVVDARGLLTGMVSDSDLLWHRVPAEPGADPGLHRDTDPSARPTLVSEVMSEHLVATEPGADVADVAQLMLDHDVRSVPVQAGGAVVGIVSRRDILRAMVRDDGALRADVQRRLDDYAGCPGRWNAEVRAGLVTIGGVCPNEQQRTTVELLARTVPGVAAVELQPVEAVPG